MTRKLVALSALLLLLLTAPAIGQQKEVPAKDTTEMAENDTLAADSAMALIEADLEGPDEEGTAEDCTKC